MDWFDIPHHSAKQLPPIFILFDRGERHETIVPPILRAMNAFCDVTVSGYEVAHLLLSVFVAQKDKDGQLVGERIRIACNLDVPRSRPDGLDL